MYVYTYLLCIHICRYIHINKYVLNTHIHVYTYTYRYVCIYVYIKIYQASTCKTAAAYIYTHTCKLIGIYMLYANIQNVFLLRSLAHL